MLGEREPGFEQIEPGQVWRSKTKPEFRFRIRSVSVREDAIFIQIEDFSGRLLHGFMVREFREFAEPHFGNDPPSNTCDRPALATRPPECICSTLASNGRLPVFGHNGGCPCVTREQLAIVKELQSLIPDGSQRVTIDSDGSLFTHGDITLDERSEIVLRHKRLKDRIAAHLPG